MKLRNQLKTALVAAGFALAATPAHAAGICQVGVLDTSGTNPATGLEWTPGDTYRLVFVTLGNTTGASTDISTYNAFVQSEAALSTAFPNLGTATWSVVGSTATVAARDNTATNPNVNGTGEAIFLMDGATTIATDYTDLWNGIANAVGLDQNGAPRFSDRVLTGSTAGGTQATDGRVLGGSTEDPPRVMTGRTDTNGIRWMVDFNQLTTDQRPVFAMSEVLTVIPEPSSVALLGLGGLALLRRRRN